MSTNTLRQVLALFENADGPLSLGIAAHELNISQARLEGMIQYWVRKGQIREAYVQGQCSSCGLRGECPFVMKMPRTYELAPQKGIIPLREIHLSCDIDCGSS